MTKSFYIIDGHAQIYAAFYAPIGTNLSAPDGEPTKATYIFTTMLLKLLRERKPDMIALTMDAPGPTFRHEMFSDYKAHRPPMPDDLPLQIDRIEEIVTAMRIPILRKNGFEADDLIGTLTKLAHQQDIQVYICSKDKDLEQLIADGVAMYDPKKDLVRDVQVLMEDKGIRPDQVIDVLTLEGDKVDNIPGVPDVGPKTALQWISKYGSLDELLKNKDQIKGKRGDNLRAAAEQLPLTRQLVTINCAVPLDIDLDDLTVQDFDLEQLENLFRKLNFTRLLDQLSTFTAAAGSQPDTLLAEEIAVSTPAKTKNTQAQYILVDTTRSFTDFLKQLKKQKIFALDTETTGLNPVSSKLVGLSFAWQDNRAWYLPLMAPMGQQNLDRETTLQKLKPVLVNPQVKKIGQNIKYDLIVLRRAGIDLKGISFDTMVASYILDSSRTSHSLDSLALDYLGHETIKLTELIGKGKNQITFDLVDTAAAADYAAEDADITWRLFEYLDNQLKDKELRKLFEDVEMPLLEVLAELEYQGIALDVPCLKKMSTQLSTRLDELTAQIHKHAGCSFNLDSPKQLSEVLFDRLGLTPVKKTKTGTSTDQEVLEVLRWQHPIAEAMLEYRQLSKLKNTYVDKLPSLIYSDTHRVHASFNQTVTATGRLSSSNPNLQNIPIRTTLGQEIRRAFVPQQKDWVILAADYSQIELRLLAHFSGDEALRRAFEENQDIHQFVASQVYDVPLDQVDRTQRSKAKAVNFGIIYGQTAYGLSRSIGIPVDEAQTFINDYFARYPRIKTFMDDVINTAKKQGFVRTVCGRRRNVSELSSKNTNRRKQGERLAVNTVIQGSAADMIKVAMINIYRRIVREKIQMKMILQVHDELVFELPSSQAPDYSQIIQHEMAHALELNVPLTVDLNWGPNWLACK